MALDRNGTPVRAGYLVEIYGKPASGKEVVAVAENGIYVEWSPGEQKFLADADRCYTSLGERLWA